MDFSQYLINDNMASMANMYARQNTLDIIQRQRKRKGFLGNILAQDYFNAPASSSMSAAMRENAA